MEIRRSVAPHQYTISWYRPLGLLPIEIKTGEFPFSSMEWLPVHESFRRYGRKDLLTSIGYFSLASRAGVYPPAARHPGKVCTGGSECSR